MRRKKPIKSLYRVFVGGRMVWEIVGYKAVTLPASQITIIQDADRNPIARVYVGDGKSRVERVNPRDHSYQAT